MKLYNLYFNKWVHDENNNHNIKWIFIVVSHITINEQV